ncbi:MAG: hypothetical protein KGZ25_09485 [Planctomycetes bacterium]|nr:hypothetical protein [Planctomycetota bacterium]
MVRSRTAGKPGGSIVLVASRKSKFKVELADKIRQSLLSRGITQETVGVEDLKTVNGADYDAVVIISTCIAWGLDGHVKKFLKHQANQDNIILVTTSATGNWEPGKIAKDVDAITAASRKKDFDTLVENVLSQIDSRVDGGEGHGAKDSIK